MKVILTEKVPHLGNVSDLVNVSAGFARNFLFPRKLALLADDANKKVLENQKRRLAKKVEAEKAGALAIQKKLNGLTLEFVKRLGANGKLFGSITTSELSKELEAKDIHVEKRLLHADQAIRSIGTFDVKAKLFHDVEAFFKVKVVMDPKQVEELKVKEEENKKAKVLAKERAEREAKEAAEAAANATSEE